MYANANKHNIKEPKSRLLFFAETVSEIAICIDCPRVIAHGAKKMSTSRHVSDK